MTQITFRIAIGLNTNLVESEKVHQSCGYRRLGFPEYLCVIVRILIDFETDVPGTHRTNREIEVEKLMRFGFVGLFPEIAVH